VVDVDGNDIDSLLAAYDSARANDEKPTVIIAQTIKGKGVSFMEDTHAWHGKPPDDNELEQALLELGVGAAQDN
jgi:transketolase